MPRLTLVRSVAGLAAAAMLVAALSGCSGRASDASCTPQAVSGQASDSVSAPGALGAAPTVTFDAPLQVPTTQVSTIIPGRGAPIVAAQQIVADLTILNGTTGAVVTKTEYTGDATANAFVIKSIPFSGLRRALQCAKVGERLAAVIPPDQGIPAASRPDTLADTDDIVIVVDVLRAYLARANGTDQVMAGGLPAVVLGPDGRPGITLPDGAPPKALTVADLKRGSGAVLKAGDTAVVQYTGVLWKPGDDGNGTVFDSSWAKGAPVSLPLNRSSVITGLVTALSGRRVGSQVLAVIPPSQAYGATATSTLPPNSTLVFVVDILGKA